MLTFITINFDDVVGLKSTVRSLQKANIIGPWEQVIIDGGSSDGSREFLDNLDYSHVHIFSEPDDGIYDAMNKGIARSNGSLLHFLNSGDTISGELDVSALGPFDLLKVTVGKSQRPYTVRNLISPFAMPYCHQGMIFPASSISYDLKYSLASDLDYVYRNGYYNFNNSELIDTCEVNFDDDGVSNRHYVTRDVESFKIIYNNNKLKGMVFLIMRLLIWPLKALR